MIPQALANTGPSSGLWSRIKSMHYALSRANSDEYAFQLSQLDKEKILQFARFLKDEISRQRRVQTVESASFVWEISDESSYFLKVDVLEIIKHLEGFRNWKHSGGISLEKKAIKIAEKIEEYGKTLLSKEDLITVPPPKEEISLAKALLEKLIVSSESALQT